MRYTILCPLLKSSTMSLLYKSESSMTLRSKYDKYSILFSSSFSILALMRISTLTTLYESSWWCFIENDLWCLGQASINVLGIINNIMMGDQLSIMLLNNSVVIMCFIVMLNMSVMLHNIISWIHDKHVRTKRKW